MLALDFNGPLAAVVFQKSDSLYTALQEEPRDGSELFMIDQLLRLQGKTKLSELEVIFVNRGPGSFIATRTALAFANTIKILYEKISLLGLNLLEILAFDFYLHEYQEDKEVKIAVAIPLHREKAAIQSFHFLEGGQYLSLHDPEVIEPQNYEALNRVLNSDKVGKNLLLGEYWKEIKKWPNSIPDKRKIVISSSRLESLPLERAKILLEIGKKILNLNNFSSFIEPLYLVSPV